MPPLLLLLEVPVFLPYRQLIVKCASVVSQSKCGGLRVEVGGRCLGYELRDRVQRSANFDLLLFVRRPRLGFFLPYLVNPFGWACRRSQNQRQRRPISFNSHRLRPFKHCDPTTAMFNL